MTIRDLRNYGGDIVGRVLGGESVTVTRAGTPVAELRPLPRRGLDRETLLSRWRQLPPVDPRKLRAELDALLDFQGIDGLELVGLAHPDAGR